MTIFYHPLIAKTEAAWIIKGKIGGFLTPDCRKRLRNKMSGIAKQLSSGMTQTWFFTPRTEKTEF